MIKKDMEVELIKPCTLDCGEKRIFVSKEKPCKGTIKGAQSKKVAGRKVIMYDFLPNGEHEDCIFSFGEKWFREIKK